MEKFFNGVLKFLAGICAILFVLTAGIALLAFNAERRLFNAQLYLRAFENQGIYERLPELAAEAITASASLDPCQANPILCATEGRPPEAQDCLEAALGAEAYQALIRNQRTPTPDEIDRAQPCLDRFPQDPTDRSEGGPPDYLKALSAEDWQVILEAILPPEILRSLADQALTSIFAYLNGEADSAVISMAELKSHLNGAAGIEAFMQMLSAQPPCTREQVAEMTLGSLLEEQELILCNPSDEAPDILRPLIQAEIQLATAGIPDTATLIRADAPGMQNPLQALRVARAVMRFSPLLPLGLLFLITVFAVRSLKGWLRWWGIPLLFSGLVGLALAAAVNPIFQWAFKTRISPRFLPGFPASLVETIRDLIGAIVSGVAAPILFQSIALLLIGIIMILATRIRKKTKLTPQPQHTAGEVPDERSSP